MRMSHALASAKNRVSPAMIVALLALLVAMSGTAYAAVKLPAGSVGTRQLKAEAVTSAKIKDASIRKTDLKAGVLPTPSAPQPDTSMMVARINAIPSTFDQQVAYGSPSGTSTAATTPESVAMITPNVETTASNLAVNVTVAVNNNSARRFTLIVNGVETAFSCTILGPSSSCTSTGSVAISAGSVISIRSDRPATFNAEATEARVSFLLTNG